MGHLSIIRNRFREIFENRKNKPVDTELMIHPEEFMGLMNKFADKDERRRYMLADDPSSARLGIIEIATEKQFICDIENFSEDQLEKIDEVKNGLLFRR